MANALYPLAREKFLGGDLDWDAQTFKLVLVDLADYTYSAAHQWLSDIAAVGREETSGALASKTKVQGTADAADLAPAFPAAAGDPCEALILFRDTGTPTTSDLVAYFDTGVTGLPVTLNGGDINVTFNASGIFTL
jgi:hypothetical protein